MRIEVPVWRDLATARNPTADLPAEEDSASEATGSAERSPRFALPVPVGMVEPQADEAEEATEDEVMIAEPSYAFAKGYGRFGIDYTGLATALGNFEQGDIEAESAVVAQWLTSGLRIAMARTGWNLLSTRLSLTKVPGTVLSVYWGGPLWRDRFLLWFLDPKLVPTKITFFPFLEGAKSWENQRDLRIAGEKAFGVYDNNQAYRSMVSCFFQQSDCGLARLVHVCLLQCLWWTSAVSRPSALSLCVCLLCLSFG